MNGGIGRVALLGLLAVLIGARNAIGGRPLGEFVEVRDGARIWWQPTTVRSVDGVLSAMGHAPLGVGLTIPRGEGLVRRGDGWSVEPTLLPQLEGAAVDLNRAGRQALEALPGVGRARAEAIFASRPYRSVDDVLRARGIGPDALRRMRELVSVHHAVPQARPLNLNCASLSQLQALPRVGPVLARRIVVSRPFREVDDLQGVRGIGAVTLDGLRPRVRVGDCR